MSFIIYPVAIFAFSSTTSPFAFFTVISSSINSFKSFTVAVGIVEISSVAVFIFILSFFFISSGFSGSTGFSGSSLFTGTKYNLYVAS